MSISECSHLTNFLSAIEVSHSSCHWVAQQWTNKQKFPALMELSRRPSSRDTISKLICKLNKQLKLLSATEKNRAKKAGSECVCEGRNFTLSASGGFHWEDIC